MNLQRVAAITLLCVIAAAMVSCGAQLCHGATTTEPTALGTLVVHTNPNTSLVGSIVEGRAVTDSDGRVGTALRLHPIGTYGLFDEDIVFCGDESLRVTTAGGRLLVGDYVYIYRQAASRLINGVPCFSLQGIYKLEKK